MLHIRRLKAAYILVCKELLSFPREVACIGGLFYVDELLYQFGLLRVLTTYVRDGAER